MTAVLQDAETRRFLDTYLELMDVRIEHLADAVRREEVIEAQIVAMTLHSTSVMVGASDVARLANGIEQELAHHETARAQALLPRLLAAGEKTVREFRDRIASRRTVDDVSALPVRLVSSA